jgi:mRNA interferase RelE/StbE
MDAYKIEWKRSAVKDLNKAPRDIVNRLITAIGELAAEPFPMGVRKLSGTDRYFRIRVGDFRVVYGVYTDRLTIEIVRIGHRKDIYRR